MVLAIGLGGAMAYGYKNSDLFAATGSTGTEGAPVVQAATGPVKVRPKKIATSKPSSGGKLIYDRLRGNNNSANRQVVVRKEKLVGRVQDVVARSDTSAQNQLRKSFVEDTASANKLIDKTNVATRSFASGSALSGSTTPARATTTGPRKVKTLIVRPDGTIVQPSLAVKTPVEKTLKTVSGSKKSATQRIEALGGTRPAAIAPVKTASTKKPTASPRKAVKPVTRTAAVVARPAAVQSAGNGKFVVQVTARRDQTSALEAFANLQQKYPGVLASYQPLIQRADLGKKGIFYRLRVGPLDTKSAAGNLCGRLKAKGLKTCFVRPM